MNKEKRVVLSIVFGLVVISSVLMVSAGIADWFKFGSDDGGEGELPASTDVSISMSNSAPHIDSWSEPDLDNTLGGIQAWPPTSCTTTTVATGGNSVGVDVIVLDSNGDGDLNNVGLVGITVSRGATSHVGSCTLDASTISGDNSDNFATFNCQFDMDFYDPAAGDWEIEITAQDVPGDPADNNNQQSDGGASYPFFAYESSYDIRVKDDDDPDYITAGGSGEDTLAWTGILAEDADVLAGIPKGAGTGGGYLTVQNCGNEPLDGTAPYNAVDSYITVKGFDLSNPGNTDKMEPDTFMVDEAVAACTAGQLLDNADPQTNIVATPVLDVLVSAGATQEGNLYFCLKDINPGALRGNDPITSDGYSTTNPGGTVWEVNACESGC